MTTASTPANSMPDGLMSADEFDELDAILDELRSRYDETPQWEFCEGYLAALVCCRRPIERSEALDLLLALSDGGAFADDTQRQRFESLWQRRCDEVKEALDAPVESLQDERAYSPEVMDVRGAVAALPETERAAIADEVLPAFAQVWALGFMFVVENWPEEWAAPRDRDAAKWLDASLESIVALTEDDLDPPTLSAMEEDGPPSVSASRMQAFAGALWAVIDLREIWRNIGPRVETVRKAFEPGRNDPCPCGSGKKYKKCHGA